MSISKIDIIKIKQHRAFPKNATFNTLTLKGEPNYWYVVISFEIPDKKDKVSVRNGVCIDVIISHFATLSDGITIENPKHLAQSESELANAQRIFCKQGNGTKARERVKSRVARIHRKIGNQRVDYLPKVSRKLVDSYDLIAY